MIVKKIILLNSNQDDYHSLQTYELVFVMYLTHLFGAYSLIRLFNDFICKPERLKFGISKFKFIGPVSFIAWTEVA